MDADGRTVGRFRELSRRAAELYRTLRDLPQFGRQQWRPCFTRCLKVYAELWELQGTARAVLVARAGLQRAEIGDIASKIAQLYYHFYLRTADTAYLEHSFRFYESLRDRKYYDTGKQPGLADKLLRVLNRFLTVALLMRRLDFIQRDLLPHMNMLTAKFAADGDGSGSGSGSGGGGGDRQPVPDKAAEWQRNIKNTTSFLEAATSCSRALSDAHFQAPLATARVVIGDAIIAGLKKQVRFHEMTMDQYRILSSIEAFPSDLRARAARSVDSAESLGRVGKQVSNPHKYLLSRPVTTEQLQVFLATCTQEVEESKAVLLYISSGSIVTDDAEGVGVVLDSPKSTSSNHRRKRARTCETLLVRDVLAYGRRPLFVILDCPFGPAAPTPENRFGTEQLWLFGAGLPAGLGGSSEQGSLEEGRDRTREDGSLLTMFLDAPLQGLCFVSKGGSMAEQDRAAVLEAFHTVTGLISTALAAAAESSATLTYFLGDYFLHALLVHFVFCRRTLLLHTAFGPDHMPRAFPVIELGADAASGVDVALQALVMAVGG